MKTYTAPVAEIVKLTAMEAIAENGGNIGGDNSGGQIVSR